MLPNVDELRQRADSINFNKDSHDRKLAEEFCNSDDFKAQLIEASYAGEYYISCSVPTKYSDSFQYILQILNDAGYYATPIGYNSLFISWKEKKEDEDFF